MAEDVGLHITPRQVIEQAHRGRDRLRRFRNARMMFLRNYRGPYYDAECGEIGTEPMNLIFNAIRILLPHIVTNFPTFKVTSRFLAAKDYAELLGMAIDQHSQTIDISSTYRCVIVDAIFALGILKTGLAQSDSIYAIDENDRIDGGTVYTEKVDFDNFVPDPTSREHLFRDARFLGDILTVPRRTLLESGLYKNDLVERLPKCGAEDRDEPAYKLSMQEIESEDAYGLEDEVEVIELWVPAANALVTVPASKGTTFDDYLRVDDYYGPKEGGYTFLSLSPPMPGNPLPVPAVGIWNDLHVLANKMAKKIIDQACRQRDILGYRGSAADDAAEIQDAKDGEAVKMDDPDGVKIHSMGGQQQSNEVHLQQLQGWFNMMAGNPEQIGGARIDSGSATESRILAGNASIGLEDMKDLVYKASASEGRKRAWYFDSDPMMQVPLIRRRPQPPMMAPGPMGPMMMAPAQMVEEQIILTPELRRGEFLDFMFSVEPESMGRRDAKTRLAEAIEFAVKVIPAAAAASQTCMMMGVPFSFKEFVIEMARLAGITWMDRVFYDPEFQMQMMQRMMMGPQAEKGQMAPQSAGVFGGIGTAMMGGGGNMMGQIGQNGQPSNVGSNPGMEEQIMSEFQSGANQGQQMVQQYA